MMAKHSPHRNRRHTFDQLVSIEWALERLISIKGPNKDFMDFKPEVKEAFEVLWKFTGKCRAAYENYLWETACKEDKLGIFDESRFPDNLKKKLQAVKDYREYAQSQLKEYKGF